MSSLFLPENIERAVSPSFALLLRETDPNLIVYFNPHKKRWVIDRCTRGGEKNAGLHEHTNDCPRTNVMVVEDEGKYMPLCDQVIDNLRAKDLWNQHATFEQYDKVTTNAADADKADRERKVDQLYRDASVDNRRQLLKAFHLIQQHDTARVNQ